MSNTAHETALINFGRETLRILERDQFHNSHFSQSIPQAIADIAESHGLATTDGGGMFTTVSDDEFLSPTQRRIMDLRKEYGGE